MNVPKARKLPSGSWNIQMRLGGRSLSVTRFSERACIREAERIKAAYRATGALTEETGAKEAAPAAPTLRQMAEKYVEARRGTKSPNTIRTYVNYINHRLNDIIDLPYDKIDWQAAIDAQAKKISGKSLREMWGFFASVLAEAGAEVPKVKLPALGSKPRGCLFDDEILQFTAAMRGKRYEVAALLALHSLRASEIWALRWEDINFKRREINVSGAVVRDEYGVYTRRECGKTQAARRSVPIVIDRLYTLLMQRAEAGEPVVPGTQNGARLEINAACKELGLPPVGLHGLRHSFASLAASLGLPERAAMQMGGWEDVGTMRKTYTHVNAAQVLRGGNAMREFFKNANKNANGG